MRNILMIMFYAISFEVCAIELNWVVNSKLEIGKAKVVNVSGELGLCDISNCIITAPYYPNVFAGLKVGVTDSELISKISGVSSYSALEKLIKTSEGFKAFGSNENCKQYTRSTVHASPESFGMSNNTFIKIYLGYSVDSGWWFHENEVVEFCGDVINFKRIVSF